MRKFLLYFLILIGMSTAILHTTEFKTNEKSTNFVLDGTQFDHPEELPFPVELV